MTLAPARRNWKVTSALSIPPVARIGKPGSFWGNECHFNVLALVTSLFICYFLTFAIEETALSAMGLTAFPLTYAKINLNFFSCFYSSSPFPHPSIGCLLFLSNCRPGVALGQMNTSVYCLHFKLHKEQEN